MTVKAHEILDKAAGHMRDRATTYDRPGGERSMPNAVAAFNAITGHSITAEQGWLFMALLKAVRTQQGDFRADNYEDGAAYFALAGEQAEADRCCGLGVIEKIVRDNNSEQFRKFVNNGS